MADTNNLVILMFEGVGSAAVAFEQLEEMEEQNLLSIEDAIIVERDDTTAAMLTAPVTGTIPGAVGMTPATTPDDRFRVVQARRKRGKLARVGGAAGFLAGLVLGGPLGGLVVGAGLGALTGALKDFGIDDKNIEIIKARLQPNTSALMVLGHAEDPETFVTKLRAFEPYVISTSLPAEMEKRLRERLGSA